MNERKKRILYVDGRDIVEGEEDYREINGMDVFVAGDEQVGKRLYDEHKPIDLIGVHTACMDYFEFAKFLRKRDRNLPIVVVSAMKEPSAREAIMNLKPQPDDIIWKDDWRESLETTLGKLVIFLKDLDSRRSMK